MPAFYFIAANGCRHVQNKMQYRFGQIYAHVLLNSDVVQPLAFLYLLNAYSAMVYLLFIFVGGGHLFYHCYDMDIFDRKFFIQYYRNNIFVAQQNSFS